MNEPDSVSPALGRLPAAFRDRLFEIMGDADAERTLASMSQPKRAAFWVI
jgi:hypothetical protein